MAFEKISVGNSGVEFAYSDSGPVALSSCYTTIVAIHGFCFSAAVFQKIESAAPGKAVRVISLNRRNYPGSSPFLEKEVDVVMNGSQVQKDEWMKERGHELAYFIDAAIRKMDLPPISVDGASGGIVILGWSLGAGDALATIAHADTLPPAICSRLTSFIRSVVLYEPPALVLGLPAPEKSWAPENIPMEIRLSFFAHWITSYFDHGDLSTRDPNLLEYVVPSTTRPGSIYNMSKAEQESVICVGEGAIDPPYMFGFGTQFNAAYRKSLFDPATRKLFSDLKISHLAGARGPAFSISVFWSVQEEAEKQGLDSINFRLAPGVNHFVHWDDPERAIDLFLE